MFALLAGRKLLLADNSLTIQKVVELTFADEGVEVVSVSDGQEAIERIEEVGPDIILADVLMPRRSGYEVCEHVKQNAKLKHIPVMLLVGSFEPFDEAEARRVGADDILTKPFQSIRRLMDKVGDLVSPKPAAAEDHPPSSEAQSQSFEAQSAKADELMAELPKAEQPATEFLEEEVPTAELPKTGEPVAEKRLSTGDLEVTTADTRPLPAGESFANYVASPPGAGSKPREEATRESWENRNMERTATESQNDSYLETGDILMDLGNVGASSVASSDDFVLDLDLDEPFEASAVASSSFSDRGLEPQVQTIQSSWEAQHSQPTSPSHASRSESLYRTDEIVQPNAPRSTSVSESPTAEAQERVHEPAAHVVSRDTQPDLKPERVWDVPREPVKTSIPAGLITLDQLSPEVINEIARRAVAQLSEKVVQEIAWEVVPQLAELLIKRKLEEKESQPK